MAQSMGVQQIQRSGRSRAGLGPVVALVAVTVAALFLAPAIWAGNTPAVRPAPNPVPRVEAPANVDGQTAAIWQNAADWQTAARNAGYTGRVGAATPQVSPIDYGQWMTAAKAAGFTGRLGASTPATSSTPDAGGVNFTDKLKAGRA